LTLSANGRLSGTLSASIPGGVYGLRVIATEKVTTTYRGRRSVTSITADFATQISVSGPTVIFSNPTVISSGISYVGVAVDTSGHVFVTDPNNNQIVRMNTDGSNLTVIGSGFRQPFGVAVDTAGHVFVADMNNQRVVKMNTDGSNQTVIGSGFSYPHGVAVDTAGHVFVADTYNTGIVVLNGGFSIPDQPIPSIQAGRPLVAKQLVGANVDPSTSPAVTSVNWFASSLPAGLKLSSSGVLSGTPRVALAAGTYSIYVSATEKVTTKIGQVATVTTKATSRVLQIVIS
jgi:hypothetical protein